MSQRYKVPRVLEIDKTPAECAICNRIFMGARSLKSHITQVHTNSNRKVLVKRGKPVGTPAWNSGKTKFDDARIAKYGKTHACNVKNGKVISGFSGKKHDDKTRRRISAGISSNNKGGRCKWYDIGDQRVQGTWERNVAIELNSRSIRWNKVGKNGTIKYVDDDGKIRHYTPDFFLPDESTYLEIKGFWWRNDRRKMQLVTEQHPNIRIVILEKECYEKFLRGEQVW